MNWTQEQRDQMIALWDNGKRSYSEIAQIMGVTKNSIVGRMRREKAIRGIEVDDQYSHRTRTNKVYQKREKKMRLTLPDRTEFNISQRIVPTIPKPDEGQLASIIDATGCKWPVKDDPAFVGGVAFCNHHTDEGHSYCPYHTSESVASYSRTLISKTVRSAWHVYKKAAA